MTITSEDIMIDVDNPSQERLIIKARGSHNYFDDVIVDIIHQRQTEGWNFESRFFHSPQVAYVIFTRPIKLEIDWYARLIEHYPDMLFNRA